MAKIDDLSIKTIMMLSADAVQKANSGHPGMPMGDAAMAYVLWQKFLKHNPKNPHWHNRDRFVLSAGHGSMLLYSLLHLTGHNISMQDIKDFRQWGSKTPGHSEYDLDCGIETTTGPLGQGFANGVGMAMAERFLADTFNKPGHRVVDYHTYAIVSDGDLMEGVTAEAASIAGHLKLGKLIYLYSDNKITIEGSTSLTFTENVRKRFDAYGWHTQKIDGYDLKGIEGAIRAAQTEKGKPSLILVQTHIGYGSPHKQDTADAHGAPLGEEEIRIVKEKFGLPQKKFYVPKDVRVNMKKAAAKGGETEKKWTALMKSYKRKYPALKAQWDAFAAQELPEGWDRDIPRFTPADGSMATRKASGLFLNAVADKLSNLIGGSADLSPSNNTFLKGFVEFSPDKSGRNIHFGVREHAMGSILNGMALSDMLIPYGGTFLIFSQYFTPPQRLAALMKKRVIYVLTHDSIGLGEDGPTHQPVEHLSAHRAMPNMVTLRPADANETVEAWKFALAHTSGPVSLILTRQGLPILDRKQFPAASNIKKGAYVLYKSKIKPKIILLASGSEVHITLEAARQLERERIGVQVVNVASFELFDRQSRKYRDSVLPPEMECRISVEAGVTLCWHKYVGLKGTCFGIDHYGASAPGAVILEKFGFTAQNIARMAIELIKGK